MKKILAILIVVSMIFTLCACKKNKDKDSSSTPSSQASSNPSSSMPSSTPSSSPSSDESVVSDDQAKPTVAHMIDVGTVNISGLEKYENNKKGWGQGKQVDADNRPITCDPMQKKFGEYGGIFIMPKDEKKIYLTFDEGYENGYTAKILDALKEKDCKAVFFVTMPYVKANADLIKRMIDEGHVVGNHSVRHKSMPTLTSDEAAKEITELHNYMVENYNYHMTLFRPPMGEWSTRTLVIAKELGYKTVLWSYAYLDYDTNNQMGVEKAFPRVTGAAHSGAVYLLHAVSKDNADMMANIVDDLRGKGYEFNLLK
ncbi:polysaccharide deacetylase family protein [Paludicola sp. MB14-C6]|uniref:polysaccharide deacetylase family protein n=1 Tax=Paludihabitans sp. MB14-C6 TaxID=3070656 RepID=UPI0027DC64FC|nr:polysaccharide deacetylase family protein [Paludicola sp. MB14-C6]WMJ24067.1 polysaccharide deacetylase family protein [Paludicola sp. MB14-C6]